MLRNSEIKKKKKVKRRRDLWEHLAPHSFVADKKTDPDCLMICSKSLSSKKKNHNL